MKPKISRLNYCSYLLNSQTNYTLTNFADYVDCAILVWVRLKEIAYQTKRTIYDLKNSLLDDYLIQQLKPPTNKFA